MPPSTNNGIDPRALTLTNKNLINKWVPPKMTKRIARQPLGLFLDYHNVPPLPGEPLNGHRKKVVGLLVKSCTPPTPPPCNTLGWLSWLRLFRVSARIVSYDSRFRISLCMWHRKSTYDGEPSMPRSSTRKCLNTISNLSRCGTITNWNMQINVLNLCLFYLSKSLKGLFIFSKNYLR